MNQVLINDKGELLEILQESKEPQDNQFVVPLEGYYEVLNEQRYNQAIWDFEQNMWIGVGEARPVVPAVPSDIDLLKADNEMLKLMVADLGLMVGGGL